MPSWPECGAQAGGPGSWALEVRAAPADAACCGARRVERDSRAQTLGGCSDVVPWSTESVRLVQ